MPRGYGKEVQTCNVHSMVMLLRDIDRAILLRERSATHTGVNVNN